VFEASDSHQLDVYPAGSTPSSGTALITGFQPTLTPDTYVSLILSGLGDPLDFVETRDDLSEVIQGRARLRMFHLASDLEAIDVHVETEVGVTVPMATGLQPGEVSPVWMMSSGEVHISVYAAGATEP